MRVRVHVVTATVWFPKPFPSASVHFWFGFTVAWSPLTPKSTTQPPSPARELVAQVIAAGGELQRESKDGLRAYTLLVAAVNRHHLAPEGKQLTVEMGSPWGIVMIKLEDAPCWLTTPSATARRICRPIPSGTPEAEPGPANGPVRPVHARPYGSDECQPRSASSRVADL